jgi:hypothetical protein
MKYTMIKFLLFILMMNYFNKSLCSQDLDTVDKHKLIQCKLCQEMFKFNFNFDEMLKSKQIENIKKVFDSLQVHPDELKGYFSKDNMDFVLKEISMQYFFKGGDSLPDESQNLKLKNCKEKNSSDECENIKLQICQKVLSFEEGICVNMKKHLKNLMMKASLNKSEISVLKESNIDKIEKNMTFQTKNSDNLKRQDNQGILNFQKYQFKQRDKDPDVVKQFGDISLLELSPEYIKNNFDSIPKTHWKPPKPVLLQNFERNIGDQLKDISSLAR